MSKLRLCAALTLGTDGHSLNERMLFLADLARAVLAKSKTSENKIYAPNFREARGARASAINWPIARAVVKSRLVIRLKTLLPGIYAPEFREASARAILANLARAVLAKSRPVIRQNATSGNLCPEFPRGARRAARALALLIGR